MAIIAVIFFGGKIQYDLELTKKIFCNIILILITVLRDWFFFIVPQQGIKTLLWPGTLYRFFNTTLKVPSWGNFLFRQDHFSNSCIKTICYVYYLWFDLENLNNNSIFWEYISNIAGYWPKSKYCNGVGVRLVFINY